MFQQDQKRVYQQLNGKTESSEKPDTEERRRFWRKIWGTKKSHNENAEWLKELRSERNKVKQGDIQITTEMVTRQTRKVNQSEVSRARWSPGLLAENLSSISLKNFNANG